MKQPPPGGFLYFQADSGAAENTMGTTGGQTFDRQSWVGLSGGFGEVQIGKPWTAFDDVIGASNAMFDATALAPLYYVFKSAAYKDHPANGLRYNSPTFAGFTGVVTYAQQCSGHVRPEIRVAGGALTTLVLRLAS